MTHQTAQFEANYLEVIADIAFTAGNLHAQGQFECNEDTPFSSLVVTWAREFERAFDVNRDGDRYIALVGQYAVMRAMNRHDEANALLAGMKAH